MCNCSCASSGWRAPSMAKASWIRCVYPPRPRSAAAGVIYFLRTSSLVARLFGSPRCLAERSRITPLSLAPIGFAGTGGSFVVSCRRFTPTVGSRRPVERDWCIWRTRQTGRKDGGGERWSRERGRPPREGVSRQGVPGRAGIWSSGEVARRRIMPTSRGGEDGPHAAGGLRGCAPGLGEIRPWMSNALLESQPRARSTPLCKSAEHVSLSGGL